MQFDKWLLRVLPLAIAGTILTVHLRHQASLHLPPSPQTLPVAHSRSANDQDLDQRVAELIRKLASEDPDERDRASRELQRTGESAKTALVDALETSPDPEIKMRARDILKSMSGNSPVLFGKGERTEQPKVRPATPHMEELPVTLDWKLLPWPRGELIGSCHLPEGTVLKIHVARVAEYARGNEIQPDIRDGLRSACEIVGNRFTCEQPFNGPGTYRVQVSVTDELQKRELLEEVSKKVGKARARQFEFQVWGDDLVGSLLPKRLELNRLVEETQQVVARFEEGTLSQKVWAAKSKGSVALATTLERKLYRHELSIYYSAAITELSIIIRCVVNSSPYFTFDATGRFTGARNPGGAQLNTPWGDSFNWANIERHVYDTIPMSGREFCLWIIKDLRRTGGIPSSGMREVIRSQKSTPGVKAWNERLERASFSDLDDLEAEIRGGSPAGRK